MNQYMFAFVVITILFIAAMFIAASALEPENPAPKPSPTPDPQELKCSVIYDVPLSNGLQIFAQEICQEYNVDFKLVLAIIAVESGFRSTAYNEKTDCCGLMQVNAVNLPVLREKLGVTDLFTQLRKHPQRHIHTQICAQLRRRYSARPDDIQQRPERRKEARSKRYTQH